MVLTGAVNREGKDELLTVFKHLLLPLGSPLLEDVLADLGRSTINAHLQTVAAVTGNRPHRHDREADGDGRGMREEGRCDTRWKMEELM